MRRRKPKITCALIEEIKKLPIIYDAKHPDYRNRVKKDRIFNNLAKKFQEPNGNVIKSRWKNLRDGYIKHLRANSGLAADETLEYIKTYKWWPWSAKLKFLAPYITIDSSPKETNTTLIDIDEDNKSAPEDETHDNTDTFELKPLSTNMSNPTSSSSSTCQQPMTVIPYGITPNKTIGDTIDIKTESEFNIDVEIDECSSNVSFQQPSSSYQYFQQNQSTDQINQREERTNHCPPVRLEGYDETDLLFLAYSKTVKQMTKQRQATVKFQIAKIMMEAEILQDSELTKDPLEPR